uniref:Kelch like family member 10 n=1 Tax=Tetraodon nigroviridis TaxID=99883 RepID=H3BX17_TETNG
DAVIKVDHAEFPVHKIILSKCSRYFQALFTNWSAPDKKVYEIPNLSADMTRLIIAYAYTNTVSVTPSNAMELLLAADQFNIMGIVEACCDLLMEALSADNCLAIWRFSDAYYCSQLQRKAFQTILYNFEKVISSKEFLQLSVEELCDIFDHDELNVKTESMVFEAICKWISHIPERRKKHFAILLPKVRLALLSLEYMITNMVTSELLNNNAECWEMVLSALQLKMQMATSNPPLNTASNIIAHPRVPKDILLAIGGWIYEDVLDVIEAYNDLNTGTWHEVAPMHYRRCYVSVTVLDGHIYALGGHDGTSRQKSAERYTPDANQWSLITPMHEKRSDASCATLNNKIYICGGFNGEQSLQTGECYDPKTNQWTMIASMDTRRAGLGVVAYVGHIYVVGGFDGYNHLKSVEAYNPETDTWHFVPSLHTERSNFGIEVIDDQIFVVGGFNGLKSISSAECYDAHARRWFEAEEMENSRFGLSCCLISG